MQIFFNGLCSGAAIALLAVAFQVVYLPTRVFFLALGGVYTLAPFVSQAVLSQGAGWPVAICTTLGASVGLSLIADWANHGPLARKHSSDGAHLVASLGLYILIVQAIAVVWGNETRTLRTGLDTKVLISDLVVTGAQWRTLGVSALSLAVFFVFLRHTSVGMRLRAMADNPVQFALLGYNVDRHRLLAFGLSGFLGATASLLASYDVGFDPHVGLDALLLAIVAVIVGGRYTFWGPAAAGIILGILRAETAWLWGSRWQDAASFALLLLFLLARPQGLVGQRVRLEAEG